MVVNYSMPYWWLSNIDVDVSTIRRALPRRGFTYKKVRSSLRVEWVAQSGKTVTLIKYADTRPARERDEDVRLLFQADIGENYRQRARRHDYFVRGQRYFNPSCNKS